MFLGRKLAEGVAGWMMHEFHCDRSELFSEKYLSVPIGQILSAEFGTKVYSEVDHPILSTMAVGAGRRPQIDFAILDPYPKIKVAVESKWIGKHQMKLGLVIWDLIRLEMLCHHFNATCFFVLGGRKKSLDGFFSTDAFLARGKSGKYHSALRIDKARAAALSLYMTVPSRRQLLKKLFSKCQELEIPRKIKWA